MGQFGSMHYDFKACTHFDPEVSLPGIPFRDVVESYLTLNFIIVENKVT